MHPTEQVTFYTRQIDDDGVLRDVFLSDRRGATEGLIYTAAEAYLVRNGEGTTLIMVDGLAQRLNTADKRMATAKFRDFSFDISGLVNPDTDAGVAINNMTTPALIKDWQGLRTRLNDTGGILSEELHARFAQPLFCIVAAMVGFATLLVGGFSRFGVWREIVIAFGLLIAIDGLRGVIVDPVREDASMWPLMYVPSLLGSLLVGLMLFQASNPNWLRRLRRKEATA